MARSWAELLGDDTRGGGEEAGPGFFGRLRDSLGKSRRALTEQLALGSFDPADEAAWERLEAALIAADIGVPAAGRALPRRGRAGGGEARAAAGGGGGRGRRGVCRAGGDRHDPRRPGGLGTGREPEPDP